MWLDSGGKMKLKDIAATLGLGETQIRKWKSVDRWADALNSNVTNGSNSNVTNRRKTGAPKGNKNAVGNRGGAPKGNQNAKGNRGGTGGPYGNKKAVTTGEYETIWLDALDDEERELLNQIDTDPLAQVNEAIMKLELRERRMLLRIKHRTDGLSEKQRRVLSELKAIKDVMTVHDEKTGGIKTVPMTRMEMVQSEIEETELPAIDYILRIEEALTRVQGQKIKVIELKNKLLIDEERKIRIEKMKFELQMLRGGDADQVEDDGFIEALRGKIAEVWSNDGTPEA